MAGTKKTRQALFEDFDAPFAVGEEPSNQDFQDLGASFVHQDDAIAFPGNDGAMAIDEVFVATDGNYFERDPNGADRNFNPSGSFARGHEVILVNTADAAETLTFDSAGIAVKIRQNEIGRFIHTGAAWRVLQVSALPGVVNLTDAEALADTLLTIAAGAITVTHSFHTLDTEAAAATDDLDTINGGPKGNLLALTARDAARTVVLKDGTGNLRLAGDFSLDNTEDTIVLLRDPVADVWLELARSDNAS